MTRKIRVCTDLFFHHKNGERYTDLFPGERAIKHEVHKGLNGERYKEDTEMLREDFHGFVSEGESD